MRSRSSFVTLGLLTERKNKTKKKTRTMTVWSKMELWESLVKRSVRPFNSSTCTLQTENTGKKEKAMDQRCSSPKSLFLSAGAFPDILPFLCGRRSKWLRLGMQHCDAVTQSFLWVKACGYGTDAVRHKHRVCKVFRTEQILHMCFVLPITTEQCRKCGVWLCIFSIGLWTSQLPFSLKILLYKICHKFNSIYYAPALVNTSHQEIINPVFKVKDI